MTLAEELRAHTIPSHADVVEAARIREHLYTVRQVSTGAAVADVLRREPRKDERPKGDAS